MPVIQRLTSIPATSVVENTVAGSAFEFARFRQVISMGVIQAATGLFVTIQGGADIIAEEFQPEIDTRYPIIPDEMYYTDVMEVGDRLVVRVRNSTAGAIDVYTLVQISQL